MLLRIVLTFVLIWVPLWSMHSAPRESYHAVTAGSLHARPRVPFPSYYIITTASIDSLYQRNLQCRSGQRASSTRYRLRIASSHAPKESVYILKGVSS